MTLAKVGTVTNIRMVSSSGPAYGPDTPKYYVELAVDCDGRTATFTRLRSSSDEPAEPIGLFRSELPSDRLDSLLDLFKQVGFGELRELQGVTPGHAVITVTVEGEDDTLERKLSPIDGELMAQGAPLVDGLFGLAAEISQQPVAAIAASLIDQGQQASQRFSVMIKNIGSESAAVRDPRRLPQNETGQAGLRIAEIPPEEPGVTAPPLEWRFVPVVTPDDTSSIPELVTLAAGESKLFPIETVDDVGKSSTLLVQALYIDYGAVQAPEQTYQVRGATFSEMLEIEG